MKMDRPNGLFLGLVLSMGLLAQSTTVYAETSVYGKIVGLEARDWGMHVQTDFAAGGSLGCGVSVGAEYMYDFQYGNSMNSPSAAMEKSMLLSAFTLGKDVSFHLYSCNSSKSRPVIGYIRLK